jgi:hypothetical protein
MPRLFINPTASFGGLDEHINCEGFGLVTVRFEAFREDFVWKKWQYYLWKITAPTYQTAVYIKGFCIFIHHFIDVFRNGSVFTGIQ